MRYYAPIKISENIRETPEGFLVCIGVPIARTGSMIYDKSEIPLDPDSQGKITVSRSAKEVFRPETIASFEGKPITITHPKEDVTPDNWKELAKGEFVNIRKGDTDDDGNDTLIADLLVKDRVAINLVKAGLREVSCGYDADWIQEEAGKGWQENIRGNHLALVDQGRAGSNYAINDSNGKGQRMKLSEKIRAMIFSKGLDEAMKEVDASDAAAAEGGMTKQIPATGTPAMAKDAYDDLKKGMDAMKSGMDALSEKISAMGKKSGDESEVPPKKKEVEAGDEEVAPSMEDRLKACEAAVAKLLEMQAGTGDEESEEDGVGDEESEEESADDDDFEESTMVGDSASPSDVRSRAEILAPGIKDGKDVKARALKAAYGTKDGKRIIESINGGRAPAFDSAEKVNTLFTAASELLKATRASAVAKTKQRTGDAGDPLSEAMTPEMINKKNEEFYAKQRAH